MSKARAPRVGSASDRGRARPSRRSSCGARSTARRTGLLVAEVWSTSPSRWLKPSRRLQPCQDSRCPSSVKAPPLGLRHLERPAVGARREPRDECRRYSPHHGRGARRSPARSISSSSAVSSRRAGTEPDTGFAWGCRPGPNAPTRRSTRPPSAIRLGDEESGECPDVEDDEVEIGDAAGRELVDEDPLIGAQGMVDVVELVDGHVRLLARAVRRPSLERRRRSVEPHVRVCTLSRCVRDQQVSLTMRASPAGEPPARRSSSKASSSALGGSTSSIDAKRQPSPHLPAARSVATAVLISSGERVERVRGIVAAQASRAFSRPGEEVRSRHGSCTKARRSVRRPPPSWALGAAVLLSRVSLARSAVAAILWFAVSETWAVVIGVAGVALTIGSLDPPALGHRIRDHRRAPPHPARHLLPHDPGDAPRPRAERDHLADDLERLLQIGKADSRHRLPPPRSRPTSCSPHRANPDECAPPSISAHRLAEQRGKSDPL